MTTSRSYSFFTSSGISPVSSLRFNSRWTRPKINPSSLGIGPSNSFESKSNNCTDVKFPIHVGIWPLILLCFMDSSRKDVSLAMNSGMGAAVKELSEVCRYRSKERSPNAEGSDPSSSFLEMSKCASLTSLFSDAGTNPSSLFSCIARNLNFVFSCCNVGMTPENWLPCRSMITKALSGLKRSAGRSSAKSLSLMSSSMTVFPQYWMRSLLSLPSKPLSSR
mmetsp:Transcript_5073/g.13554  ORF Transcript_5073/g.13554 Transcript_5073/m.13554 type:complete len:221 (+) Transcript_5073:1814-2476(+)